MDLNFNGRVNEFYNGNEWEVNLEMKMGTLIGNEFGKRLDYNEWIIWWIKLTTLEQTMNKNWIQNDFYNEKRV